MVSQVATKPVMNLFTLHIARVVTCLVVACVPIVTISCGASGSVQRGASEELGVDDVGRVGTLRISRELVRRTSEASGLAPRESLSALTEDALLAEYARAQQLTNVLGVQHQLRSSTAALVIAKTRAAADAAGAFTAEELRAIREQRWREFARPPAVRTVHALVHKVAKLPWDEPSALEQAKRLQAAVAGTQDPEAFQRAARALSPTPYEIVVEALTPMAGDGRVVVGDDGMMDAGFAAAAIKLSVGEISPLVASKHGIHLILATERLPALTVSDAELIEATRGDLMKLRQRTLFNAVLKARREVTAIQIEPAVAELMAIAVGQAPSPAAPR
jgi:parvulin-like peptidyl-prolyl isomerase